MYLMCRVGPVTYALFCTYDPDEILKEEEYNIDKTAILLLEKSFFTM